MFLWLIVLSVSAEEGVSYYGSAGFDINRLNDEGAGEWFSQLAKRSLDVNIMIFCLNMLLPAYPMDAANMVAAICGHFGLSIESTGWVLFVIGTILGIIGVVIGILFLISGSGPGVFLLLLGLYVLYTSWELYGQIKAGSLAQHPVFKHDCYHKQRTNLSRSAAPRTSQTPPASPRRAASKPSVSNTPNASPKRAPSKASAPSRTATNSPRPEASTPPTASTNSGNKQPAPSSKSTKKKKPLPRRDSARKVPAPTSSGTPSGDIETGNAEGPKSTKPKKKAPTKKRTPDV